MAGKPEQPSTLPAPPSHGHQHHQQQQQPQQSPHQSQQQQHQGIQQNSVLVYVSGENLAYATAVGQNVAATAAAAIAVGYQSQPQQQTTTQYANILQAPQVATAQAAAATFPAKTAVYRADGGNVPAPAIGCCRLKPSLETTMTMTTATATTTAATTVNSSADGGEAKRASSLGMVGNDEDDEDYAMLYRQATLGHATCTTPAMTTMMTSRENKRASESEDSTTDGLGNDLVGPGANAYQARLQHGDVYSARMSSETYNATTASRIVARPNPGDVGLLGDDGCVAYGTSTSAEQQAVDDKARQRDNFDNQQTASSVSSASSATVRGLGDIGSGAVIGACDSIRSDESSTTYSSLSSPDESQSHQQPMGQHDGVLPASNNHPGGGSACAQQAARQQPPLRVNATNNNGSNGVQHNALVLTMNGSAVITQQQQQQQSPAITVPRGWKRICTNGVIIYIR
ncbi:hypothetical protein EAG_06258 [Camponotus floridanus]|uniref:Uncharacterized protein n=1 Tax=Camponotus floridanus TaxID=104421 RepID=E2A644_CAMFO|nr:hypothetical protein EAG_06258 [Camponotus floridanus]